MDPRFSGRRAIVVGFGSIGQRHARVLVELGCDVSVVSRRQIDFPRRYAVLEQALPQAKPDYVVLADRTGEHWGSLNRLAESGFSGRVLIEKPLFDQPRPLPKHGFEQVAVAYNLRFHPLVLRLRDFLLSQQRLVNAHVYVGQYLPQWRPGNDYRLDYSAKRAEGGGVLRDLSHELDLCHWMFGSWTHLTALGGHFSPLEIDSDDTFSLLMATERCPSVTVQMNYLDRQVKRELLVNTAEHTVRIDFIAGMFEIDGKAEVLSPVDRDYTYRAEHAAMLSGETDIMCSLEQGLEVMATIAATEQAAQEKNWIKR
jgi:predicted dehydrogenase